METSELRAQLASLHPLSFGWALNCCDGDSAQAEDVLQTACVKVLDGRAKYCGDAAFKTWFFGVIRNTAREMRRRRLLSRMKLITHELPQPDPPEDPAQTLRKAETAREVRRLLEQLSQRQREVLHLVFYQEMTVDEAAVAMGVSSGSARKHYARGKTRLRELLQKDGKADE